MRRDIGNEVVVAIVTVGVVACALMFGIILSLSNNEPAAVVIRATETPSAITQTAAILNTPTPGAITQNVQPPPTDAPTLTATARLVEPSRTNTSAPETAKPSATPTFTKTSTPLPPSATLTATRILSTATFTPSATATPTFTSSATPTATATFTKTSTPLPPSATLTATRILPSATFTPSATATPTFTSGATPTATATFTPTLTQSPTPTFTSSATPTATATFTPTLTPTATRDCPLPAGWDIYVTRDGETIYDIAQAVNSSVEDLRAANCLNDTDQVGAGFEVYVPRPPGGAVVTGMPFFPQGTPPAEQGCTAPGVRILMPVSNQVVGGTFNLVGAASLPPSGYYRIDIRSNSVNTFTPYSRANQPVIGGVLAVINSDLFGNGLYWIRLTVFDQTGRASQTCAVPVIFR